MNLVLSPDAGPLFRQIERQLREAIEHGHYPPGTRLPATRQLAESLGVSRITVKNAYAELASDGLIGPREGSGTYVLAPVWPASPTPLTIAAEDWPLWQQEALARLPARSVAAEPAGPAHPAPIAFTGAGDARLFPVQEFMHALNGVIRHGGRDVLAYGSLDAPCPALCHTIALMLANNGIRCEDDEVLLTSGSQQALALICQALLQRGDAVLVEQPTYDLALDLFRTLGLKPIGVPMDAEGMITDELERLLQQHRPRLLYTMPNFQNPSGACLSGERRRHLLKLADRYNLPVVEDDYAGDLRYEGRSQPTLRQLDPGGRVIHVGSFSKMLMPGLRVGFLVARGPIREVLARCKQVTDLTSSPLLLHGLARFMSLGRYQAHLRRAGRAYRERRNALLSSLATRLPDWSVSPPQGGLFAWLRLPDSLDADALLAQARISGVLFAPGGRFFINPEQGRHFIRLNFAARTPDEIALGIARLAEATTHCRSQR